VLALFHTIKEKADLSCFLLIRFLIYHLLPMRNGGSCTRWQICELQVSISIFCYLSSVKKELNIQMIDIWSWPFLMRLLQLLVLACSLAELTWPENPKRTQLFRASLAGRRRWCTSALLSSQSTAECAGPSIRLVLSFHFSHLPDPNFCFSVYPI